MGIETNFCYRELTDGKRQCPELYHIKRFLWIQMIKPLLNFFSEYIKGHTALPSHIQMWFLEQNLNSLLKGILKKALTGVRKLSIFPLAWDPPPFFTWNFFLKMTQNGLKWILNTTLQNVWPPPYCNSFPNSLSHQEILP